MDDDMSFDGFKPETFLFLRELQQNNSKEWFEANRARYDAFYLAPALGFVVAMENVAANLNPPHKAVAKINGSLRRINRDVRFSKDKSPYNARLHLVFWTGSHPNRSSAIHLVLEPEGLGYGVGQWAFSSNQIEQYRKAISKPRPRKAFVEALKRAKAVGCDLGESELKKLPRGYEADDEWADLLRYKSIVFRTNSPIAAPEILFTSQAISYCENLFKELAPLNAWINTHIEP